MSAARPVDASLSVASVEVNAVPAVRTDSILRESDLLWT